MTLTVLLFAELQKRAQSDKLIVSIEESSIVAEDLLDQVARLKPEIAEMTRFCLLATNGQVVGKNAVIHAHDEIALLPPASGG